jgi:sugar phosphate isomerase/epimerase
MEVGIQVSSLKPLLLTLEQVQLAFAKMKDLGCHVVQLQWIDPSVSTDAIGKILKQLQIRSVSVQEFYDLVTGNLDYYTGLNAATGGTWLCFSRIPERLKSREGLDLYIEELRALQKKLDPLGQVLCFHPVTPDFTAVPGMNAVEYLLENMPELTLCLDLFHLNRNCSDMPGFIRKYAGRICMVHFKDSRGEELVPAGQGDTNWTGVAKACVEAKIPYAFVEQERWARDPYDCLKEAMDWLESELDR